MSEIAVSDILSSIVSQLSESETESKQKNQEKLRIPNTKT